MAESEARYDPFEVVGFRDDLSPRLASQLREIAYWDAQAKEASTETERQEFFKNKVETILESVSDYPENWYVTRKPTLFEFWSRHGLPGTEPRTRWRVHVPKPALSEDSHWTPLRQNVARSIRAHHNRPLGVDITAFEPWPDE